MNEARHEPKAVYRKIERMTSQLEDSPSSVGRGKPDTDPGTGPDPPPGAKPDTAHDFKLERYKFLLQQINLLNENAHRQLTLYQSLATAVIGAGVLLFLKWREWKLDAADARIATRALLGLLGILTLFVVASIVVGVVSWLDYRREEAEFLNREVEPGFRSPPDTRNLWRWTETYVGLFILVVYLVVAAFVEWQVIPRMF